MIIVIITSRISILMAVFFMIFPFLLMIIESKYCKKLIMFELKILKIPAPINPVPVEKATVRIYGTEVANPVIFPTVLGFNPSVSASLLKRPTNIYFAIITMINAKNINFVNSNNISCIYFLLCIYCFIFF